MHVLKRARSIVPALALLAFPAAAQPVEEFYKGRDMTLLVSTGPGGGYDLYARTLAQHMERHIPGKPKILLQYMPGAGGTKAANYLHGVAPRDGSNLALLSQAVALVQVLDGRGTRYNAAEFNYIGRMVSTNSVVLVWHTSPAKSFEDMKTIETAFATDGKGSQSQYNMALVRNLMGAKLRLVLGYQGSAKILHAMEMGEVHGYAYSWASLRAQKQDWLEQKKIVPLAEIGLRKSPGLGLPLLMDVATEPDHRRALELVASPTAIGRSFLTGPAVPADRVAALRRAFDATMKDDVFLADARTRKMEIDTMTGEEVQKIVAATVATPPDFIERIRKYLD